MDNTNALRKLGFSEYEIKTYLSVARAPASTVSQISRLSGVPRNKIYECLERLKNRGLIMQQDVKPKSFKISSFHKLADIAIAKKEEADTLHTEVSNIIKNLERQPPIENKEKRIWIIKGQDNTINKISHELKNTKKESFACIRSHVDMASSIRTMKECVESGVDIKIICEQRKDNIAKIKRLISIGAKVHAYDKKKFGPHGLRFSTFDERSCRITIGKPEVSNPEDYETIWSESPGMVRLLKREFEWMWNNSKQIK